MSKQESVQIMITIPVQHRNAIKHLVAQRMVAHPEKPVSVALLCREIIGEFLDVYLTHEDLTCQGEGVKNELL
jgi:hypothetical protein